MSRIARAFESARARGRKVLIPFITAGDPEPRITVPLMRALVEAGADCLELGVPFSDPMADGPVIQRSSERALAHGVSLRTVLQMVAEFRTTDGHTPVVLMGYLNPIEIMGYEAFAQAAGEAGVDGILTVDMPPEEAPTLIRALEGRGLDPVFLLAPTTTEARIEHICSLGRGFVYYVSLKGVTGSDKLNADEVARHLEPIRRHSELPIAVGFGIKDAESAARVAALSDAVVVGSMLVARIEAMGPDPRVAEVLALLLAQIRRAVDDTAAENGSRPRGAIREA